LIALGEIVEGRSASAVEGEEEGEVREGMATRVAVMRGRRAGPVGVGVGGRGAEEGSGFKAVLSDFCVKGQSNQFAPTKQTTSIRGRYMN
jgi:hypothetical protein